MVSTALAFLMLLAPASALFYDVIQPHLVPPKGGCVPWSEAGAENDQLWANGAPPANAGAHCAQQAKGSVNKECAVAGGLRHGSICPTSYCISNATRKLAFCTSADGVPEQVNVQIAGPDAVIVQFITFETAKPTHPPTVQLGTASGKLDQTVHGVSHQHITHGKRVYYMHYVRLSGLTSRGRYYYRVTSGSTGAVSSDEFSFRAPYADGTTRIALYGDMGVYKWNNMQNLLDDNNEERIDLVIHAGDHCYNEGDLDEKRADGYMQAFEQVIANVPWMPIVGNHEYYAGTNLSRYLDSTWEEWGCLDVEGDVEDDYGGVGAGATSATSALGAFLSAGNHHAGGTTTSETSNSVPSNTSRYFSVDLGQTHLIALSLNGYNGVDDCKTKCNQEQVKWLHEDLAAVDRSKTPWVIAMSHFPFYLAATPLGAEIDTAAQMAAEDGPVWQQPWMAAEECEMPDKNGVSHSKDCHPKDWTPRKVEGNNAIKDLQPLFDEYGVDIYWAGHIHFYQTFDGPVRNGKVLMNGTHNPNGTVHVCSGNGGPPSPSSCLQYCKAGKNGRKWAHCKTCIGLPYSYTRLTVYNATDLLWEQISNKDNSIVDSWTIHQDKHGPFPL